MEERFDALTKLRWPPLDAANAASLFVWIGALALVGGLVLAAVSGLRLDSQPAQRSLIAPARAAD